jgi:L-arabinose isomerase
MENSVKLRVGLCGIGLDAYWDQFKELRSRLEGYLDQLATGLEQPEVDIVSFGLVDNPIRAREVGSDCRRNDVDILLLYVTTYSLSSTVLPLFQRAAVPVIVLNLQPDSAIDYEAFNRLPDRTAMTGAWLAYCSACPVPEIANVLKRAHVPFHQVTGVLNDARTLKGIESWVTAAKVRKILAENRLGLLGHYYNGMLDVATDITQLCITFGSHVEILEVDELSSLRAAVEEPEIAARVEEFRSKFDVREDCSIVELAAAARTSVALDIFVKRHSLTSVAYYYKGSGNRENEDTMSSIILGMSLLTARNIPAAGEYEVKNAIAMKIMDALGAGGSFTEFYAVDYDADVVLMGHDGPGHINIAEGRIRVRPLRVYHGKVGRGLSVEMSVKSGPITLLSIAEDRECGFKFVVAEGVCEEGPILEIGNTNSRYRFPLPAREYLEAWNEQGSAHHCAVGVGHIAENLEKVAKLLGIPFCKVC